MFRLTREEFDSLRSQFATSKGRGGRRYFPFAFTEQGVAMLSSVLNSELAVQVNIEIMRAFVRTRGLKTGNRELAKRLKELEKKHATHDANFKVIFDAIRQLIGSPLSAKPRKVGFKW